MGVETAKLTSFEHCWEAEIPTAASSMSQGFHKENIFSFSDEFERPQQINHIAQQSRGDKLRVQQHGFDAAAAEAGHPLVPIQEEAEEDGGIYGPAGTSNMLSEMFNFPAPAFGLHPKGHGGSSTGVSYHRLLQQRSAEESFYGCSRPDEVHQLSPSATSWSSVLGEDSAASVVKHLEIMNTDESSAGIRRVFDSSSAAHGVLGIQPSMQQLSPSTPPPATMGHHNSGDHRSQTFLGPSFGECLNLAGVGGEGQLGMRTRRSEQGDRFFFLNPSSGSNEQGEDELLHPTSVHSHLPAPQHFVHRQACRQDQQEHMSYGPVATLSIFRNSLYARAAQELLEEFCSVGRGHLISGNKGDSLNTYNTRHIRGGAASFAAAATASSSSSKEIPAMSSADRFERQRKKSKLVSMLDEVERRYNHYCEQMQMVVNSFDSVMGFGAAAPYTGLAQKAMSRHFRCLKDAITEQLKQTCELLGDKEGVIFNGSGGLTKVETPKLRLIDQSLRQQRAFHQLGMMDQQDQAWRPHRGLPDRSVTMLRAWLFDHFLHPYPSDADKHLLARQTGLSKNQVSNWFINARVRLWKPMVEDMYQKETKGSQQHSNDHDETISHSIILAAASATCQHQSTSPDHNPTLILHSSDSGSPECVPMPGHNLRGTGSHPQPPLDDDDATASPLIFPPGPPHNDMYRRPAAMLGPSAAASSQQARLGTSATTAAARTGDLSLTLGLRHAGVNPPETGRFGL